MESYSGFLQSNEWERFQQAIGHKTWRIQNTLVIRHALRGGLNYLYCPWPEFAGDAESFFVAVESIAKKEKSIFLKIDNAPAQVFQKKIGGQALHAQRIVPSRSLQPEQTTILDLKKTEAELMAAMHEKTRYNIRLAERSGVEVTQVLHGNLEDDLRVFQRLLAETAERDNFHIHTAEHYKKLLQFNTAEFHNELFFAQLKGVPLAAIMVNFYQPSGVAVYLHGASSRTHKEAMAMYLLQWRAIQSAKAGGCAQYDFWGIDEKKWSGLTRFKTRFGGAIVEHKPAHDIIYRPFWYALYCFQKLLRT